MKVSDNTTLPVYGWIGVVLMGIFWWLNWFLPGFRTHWGFFPMWLGYILTLDAWVFLRKGNSLLSRNFGKFILLFVISAPCWWLFELINKKVQYWFYLGRDHFTDLEYFILASISFSTVIPAVFETTELVSSFKWLKRIKSGPKISTSKLMMRIFFILGWIMLVLVLIWPEYFPYFVWMSLYFITEPINVWLGNPSIVEYTSNKDWRPVIALFLGSLICGFFWEMWNYYSYPKWIYQIPFVVYAYVFEMPALGYLGYLPFALELYALYHLITGFWNKGDNYLNIT
jgi:hypothetical protein